MKNELPRRQSEKLIGAWVKARGIRDQLVIATKYTIGYKNDDADVKLKVCVTYSKRQTTQWLL